MAHGSTVPPVANLLGCIHVAGVLNELGDRANLTMSWENTAHVSLTSSKKRRIKGYLLCALGKTVLVHLVQPFSHQLAVVLSVGHAGVPDISLKHGDGRALRRTLFSDKGVGPVGGVSGLFLPDEPGLGLAVAVDVRVGIAGRC